MIIKMIVSVEVNDLENMRFLMRSCLTYPREVDISVARKILGSLIGLVLLLLVAMAFLLWAKYLGGDNRQPRLKNPIKDTVFLLPSSVEKVTRPSEGKEYIVGYRIITDKYILASTPIVLLKDGEETVFSPGMVPEGIIASFQHLIDGVENYFEYKMNDSSLEKRKPMEIYGDLLLEKDGHAPLVFEGKQAILLFNADFDGQNYEINRRPAANR